MRTSLLTGLAFLAVTLLAAARPAAAAGGREAKRHEAKQRVAAILQGQAVGNHVARLRYLGEESWAVGVLSRALNDGLPDEERRHAAEAVAWLEHRSAEKTLLSFLSDPDAAVRMAGAEGLGRLRSKEIPALVPLLSDPSFGVRREAARALERMGAKGAGRALIDAASAEGEPEIRVAMLSAAGVSGDKRLVPQLVRLSEHSSEVTRLAALRALCRLGAKAGLDPARALLASDQPFTRRQGLALLEGVALVHARPLLEPLLTGADASLAAGAARTLHESGDARMLAWLVLSSAQNQGEARDPFERELARLKVTDHQRREIVRKHGGAKW